MDTEQRDSEDSTVTDSYAGPAVMVTTRGDVPVDAELVVERGAAGDGPGWSGQLDAAEDVNVMAVGLSPCVLRMPDGREGTFVPGAVAVGTGVIPVTGRGRAPFGAA